MGIEVGQKVQVVERENAEIQEGFVLGLRTDGRYYVATMDNRDLSLAPAIFVMTEKELLEGFHSVLAYNQAQVVTLFVAKSIEKDLVRVHTDTPAEVELN